MLVLEIKLRILLVLEIKLRDAYMIDNHYATLNMSPSLVLVIFFLFKENAEIFGEITVLIHVLKLRKAKHF